MNGTFYQAHSSSFTSTHHDKLVFYFQSYYIFSNIKNGNINNLVFSFIIHTISILRKEWVGIDLMLEYLVKLSLVSVFLF